ncbi:hypothetical protein EG328_000787 [Venturia inaequalis]|uniref:Uncharacterized protein n=1 Tax=Venturia inaequalis TaxID=5025 RepID=A0A8H3V1D0_VENIN|nr:hypothetical protein EG328_000787 [Venturia inaequalis]KAE9990013.1 hypothetical protein EG327_001981 [Venturia inaequalis]RDI79370.1 hypothetical protein Vi05172_g10639 [Venturia inaequalis]
MDYLQHLSLVDASFSIRNVLTSTFVVLVAYLAYSLIEDNKPIPGFEIAGREPGEWLNEKARRRFMTNAKGVVQNGFKQTKNGVFQVFSHSGPQLVLPAHFSEEIRNNPHMDLEGIGKDEFFTAYSAFSPMKVAQTGDIMAHMVNRKLTTSLALVTAPVNEETNLAIGTVWPPTDKWTSTQLVSDLLRLTSQVSSRIFLGAPLCRNPQWTRLVEAYAGDLMNAAYAMRAMPKLLRPLLYYFSPQVNRLKKTIKAARAIIGPEVQERRRIRNEALARGEAIPKRLDSIDWLDDVARTTGQDDFDNVGCQLTLTFVAIHTTSLTCALILYDIIDNSYLIPELRQEIIAVMNEDQGWQKTSLYKLKLLDSVMKESQRINILGTLTMSRFSHQDIKLSDGTVIPKGVRTSIPTLHMRDPEFYSDPNTFDGKRFLKLRELPDNANKYQFATTSSDHLGFGHGKHACPGRFFAGNEIKIMLCHLLMKYEWQFKDNKKPEKTLAFSESTLDPNAEIMYKSRIPEINL